MISTGWEIPWRRIVSLGTGGSELQATKISDSKINGKQNEKNMIREDFIFLFITDNSLSNFRRPFM
jgi:hypothetical protein